MVSPLRLGGWLWLIVIVPIFGVSLVDLPPDGWCTTRVGGQDHELPIPVFILVEEIYRRGMSTSDFKVNIADEQEWTCPVYSD